MMQETEESYIEIHKCPLCEVRKPIRGLACHAGRVHGLSSEELHKTVLHGGSVPSCKCGCGQPVKWLQRRFGEYLRGHNKAARSTPATSPLPPKRSARSTTAVNPLPRETGKSSILELSGGWTSCEQCSARWPQHMKTVECPACGPRVSESKSVFGEFLASVGVERDVDGSYKNHDGSFRVWLDVLHAHTLPGPLARRDAIEKETVGYADGGASVLRVYEDEWRNRRDVVESLVKHRLGATNRKVGARECDVIELSPVERKQFFERCHLEGDARAQWAFGLRDAHGNVVAALSVRQPFHRSVHAGKLEIARFACELETSVQGGLSRLVEVAKKKAKAEGVPSLLSYADGRLGDGKSYEKIGFSRVGRNSPRLWWTDYERRTNRFAIRADSANGVTQNARAVQMGVVELWGCSNSVYEMDLSA